MLFATSTKYQYNSMDTMNDLDVNELRRWWLLTDNREKNQRLNYIIEEYQHDQTARAEDKVSFPQLARRNRTQNMTINYDVDHQSRFHTAMSADRLLQQRFRTFTTATKIELALEGLYRWHGKWPAGH